MKLLLKKKTTNKLINYRTESRYYKKYIAEVSSTTITVLLQIFYFYGEKFNKYLALFKFVWCTSFKTAFSALCG